jgi:hypothetical protein
LNEESLQVSSPPEPLTNGQRLAILCLVIMLVLFSSLFVWMGRKAIRERHLEWTQKEAGGFYGGVESRRSAEGRDAMRLGTGMLGAACMFTIWAASMLIWTLLRCPSTGGWGLLAKGLGYVSLASQVLLCICFFWPWRQIGQGFWCGIAVWTAWALLAARVPQAMSGGRWLFVALLLTVFLLPLRDLTWGAVMSLFAFVIGFAHWFILSGTAQLMKAGTVDHAD